MLNHPVLYGPRLKFGSYLQRDSLLPPKTRELLIMRTAWLTRAEYEWGHHVESAQKAGFSDEEIRRIASGPDAPGWSEEHAAVLRAADELRREAFVSDRTWTTLVQVLRHEAPHRDHLHERRLHDDCAGDQQPRHPARARLSRRFPE